MTEGDRITITGIRGVGHHGVYEFERQAGQEFVADLTVWLDLAPAALRDDVTATVHYGELAAGVHGVLTGEPVDLIETVAERIAQVALAYESVRAVEVTVHKPAAPIQVPFGDVSVTVTRVRT